MPRTLCGLCFKEEENCSRPQLAKLNWWCLWVMSELMIPRLSLGIILFFLKCILTLLLKLFFFFFFFNFHTENGFSSYGMSPPGIPPCKAWFLHDSCNLNCFRERSEPCLTYSLIHLIDAITMHSSPSVICIYIIFPETTIVTNYSMLSTLLWY